jgi:N6-adenosine-specific RNA methylase IME4
MWVTNNHLKDGLKLMEALGFRYITNLVWVKNSFGLGQYFRGQHELCLFGVKGRLLGNSRNTSTVIHSDKTRHSEKPVSIYDLIECVSPPPYLEMFAREREILGREKWVLWGDEV